MHFPGGRVFGRFLFLPLFLRGVFPFSGGLFPGGFAFFFVWGLLPPVFSVVSFSLRWVGSGGVNSLEGALQDPAGRHHPEVLQRAEGHCGELRQALGAEDLRGQPGLQAGEKGPGRVQGGFWGGFGGGVWRGGGSRQGMPGGGWEVWGGDRPH